MNFFEHQRAAKKETRVLLFHFIFAFIGILVISNLILFSIVEFLNTDSNLDPESRKFLFIVFSIFLLILVFGGMAFRYFQLSSGGDAFGRMIGGKPIYTDTEDEDHRKILNVVDEISVASGIPSPQVYKLENEPSINAMVAGYNTDDAIVAITEGAIKHLTREELQTVVAHEYSHLFNGDMRLNTFLLSILHGIQMISLTGQKLIDISTRKKYDSSDNRGSPQLVLMGVCFWVVGYLGVLVARMIKKEINDQREFLADATAVQFTRNGSALVSVFKKILVNEKKQYLNSGLKDEIGHMCITEIEDYKRPGGPRQTHPYVVDRIKRIDKTFRIESFLRTEVELIQNLLHKAPEMKSKEEIDEEEIIDKDLEQGIKVLVGTELLRGESSTTIAEQIIESIGTSNLDSLGYTKELLLDIPKALRELVNDRSGAVSILIALSFKVSGQQQFELDKDFDENTESVSFALSLISSMNRRFLMPLLDLSLSRVKLLKGSEKRALLGQLKTIFEKDQRIILTEYLYFTLMKKYLIEKKRKRIGRKKIQNLKAEAAFVLSSLAHAGYPEDRQGAHKAFNLVMKNVLELEGPFLDLEGLNIKSMDLNLDQLRELSIDEKEKFLKACVRLTKFDTRVIPIELEVLRTISAILECPLPQVVLKR